MKKYYLICPNCNKEYEVGKNTATQTKTKKHIMCPRCRVESKNSNPNVRGKSKLGLYVCDECQREFAIEIRRYEQRLEKFKRNLCTSCSKKGERNPFFDKQFDKEQINKLSEVKKEYYSGEDGLLRRQEQSERFSGENNPCYLGAEFRSDYTWRSKSYRIKILERDNNICKCCNKSFNQQDLIAHHINSCDWAINERQDLNNGVTLCDECHKRFHREYGYGLNTRKQFDDFLREGSETSRKT